MSQMVEIFRVAGGEVIDADNGVAFAQQPVRQMGTKESGSAGNQYAHLQLFELQWTRFEEGFEVSLNHTGERL